MTFRISFDHQTKLLVDLNMNVQGLMSDVFYSTISLIFLLSFMSFFKFKNFSLQHNLFSHKSQYITEQIMKGSVERKKQSLETKNVIVNENRLSYKLAWFEIHKVVFYASKLSFQDLQLIYTRPHKSFILATQLFCHLIFCLGQLHQ